MNQLTLLADLPRARRTDPESSHDGAEAIRKHLAKQQRETLNAVRRYPGWTASEYGDLLGFAVHKRLKELEPVHVIRGPRKKCRITGMSVLTWFPVESLARAA